MNIPKPGGKTTILFWLAVLSIFSFFFSVACWKEIFSQSNFGAKSTARILNNSSDNYQQADHSSAFSNPHQFFNTILPQKKSDAINGGFLFPFHLEEIFGNFQIGLDKLLKFLFRFE